MKRIIAGLAVVLALGTAGPLLAASSYSAHMSGSLAGYRLSGVEPDGDPLYQTVLNTTLSGTGSVPRLHLIVNAYLENFKPDTTPILPDLLHPKKQAQNLGGFLQGKALITDDAGTVISIGEFVAEAFLDNSNSAVMTLYASKGGYGATGRLSGRFTLRQVSKSNVSVQGAFAGHLALTPATVRSVRANAGRPMRPITQILNAVTVTPHAMVGKATAKSRSVPLRTGFNKPPSKSGTASTPVHATSGRRISTVTIVAAIGALASFLLAGVIFLTGRRREGS